MAREFLSAREDDLRALLDSIEARANAERQAGGMRPVDWFHALRIARGDALHVPNGIEECILQRLTVAAQSDDMMEFALREWLMVLEEAQSGQEQEATA